MDMFFCFDTYNFIYKNDWIVEAQFLKDLIFKKKQLEKYDSSKMILLV